MKCKLTDKRKMTIFLAVGLTLMVVGAAAGYLLPEEMHLATRMAGFFSGLGFSLATIGGVALIRIARLGEKRARDAELAMTDERGLAVAYRAQSAAAIAAVFALVAVDMIALARGEDFYVFVCSMLLCAVALVKLAAWHIYNRKM